MKKDYGGKNCLECGIFIKHIIARDILRKKFCNVICRSAYNGRLRIDHMKYMQKLANTPESNAKKVNSGENHPLYT
jgi:hypothetical protein